jgi:MFS family permease
VTKRAPRAALPRTVWALGFVSLFMDASSELVHSLLPLYLATGLGASMLMIGLIEGVAEATAQIVKVFSGSLSDFLGKRKMLAVIGYGLAAISKPVFPLASDVAWVFGARVMDRIGKGIRGAPRDALITDITPAHMRGAAFGLRQALDSVGAFIGPLLAIGLMLLFTNDIRLVLWFAVIPAVLSMWVLVFGVAEPAVNSVQPRNGLSWCDAQRLPARFWWVVGLGAIFTLARFSEAFLVLHAAQLGLGLSFAPVVLIVLSLVYALVAYPAGLAADRLSATNLLVAGLLLLVVSDLVLAQASGPFAVLFGAALWGAHLGVTQGLLSKLVADTAPADLVGTAFGIFNLGGGLAVLLASVIAGGVWELGGAAMTFYVGAGIASCACLGVVVVRRQVV